MKRAGGMAALLAALVLLTGCSDDEAERAEREAGAAEIQAAIEEEFGTVEVLYEVEGDVSYADVTIETPTGTSQITPDVPMTSKNTGQRGLRMEFERGSFVYLAAQKKDAAGSITCRITVDGEVISENTSSGAYGIATCKGST